MTEPVATTTEQEKRVSWGAVLRRRLRGRGHSRLGPARTRSQLGRSDRLAGHACGSRPLSVRRNWPVVTSAWHPVRRVLSARGCSSMVEPQPSKLVMRVRFSSPAPGPAQATSRPSLLDQVCPPFRGSGPTGRGAGPSGLVSHLRRGILSSTRARLSLTPDAASPTSPWVCPASGER